MDPEYELSAQVQRRVKTADESMRLNDRSKMGVVDIGGKRMNQK
jgi:hypothetical protein